MKRSIAVVCVVFVILLSFAYFTAISAKAAAEIPSAEVDDDLTGAWSASSVDASVEDDDAGSDSDIWSSAISKLRSSWLSLLILVLVLIALAVVVPYRRSLGVDHKEFE